MVSSRGTYSRIFLALLCIVGSSSADAALLVVSNTHDAGPGSLRAAVASASAGDTIQFNIPTADPGYDASKAMFTIRLTTGEIVIDKDLTITGPSAANVAIGGNHASRIFHVTAGAVAMSNLSLVHGRAKGADGKHADDETDHHDGFPGVGGAVLNEARLTFTRCTFEGNTAVGGVGLSEINNGAGGDGQGGAIANQSSLSMVACTLARNLAKGGKGGLGGGMAPAYCMADCGIGAGGAIYNASTASALLINCTLTANIAAGEGGPTNGTIFGSPAAEGQGGGIANIGSLELVHSTVSNNDAVGGDSRRAFYGDGVGHPAAGIGGGLCSSAGSASSTRDTIFAGNHVLGGSSGKGTPRAEAIGPDVNGDMTSQGHNLLGRSDGCTGFTTTDRQGGTTDDMRLDPKFGALDNYGGPTETLPLLPGSPAINAGSRGGPARDQRGFLRKHVPDIGAFEYGGAAAFSSDSSPNEYQHRLLPGQNR